MTSRYRVTNYCSTDGTMSDGGAVGHGTNLYINARLKEESNKTKPQKNDRYSQTCHFIGRFNQYEKGQISRKNHPPESCNSFPTFGKYAFLLSLQEWLFVEVKSSSSLVCSLSSASCRNCWRKRVCYWMLVHELEGKEIQRPFEQDRDDVKAKVCGWVG